MLMGHASLNSGNVGVQLLSRDLVKSKEIFNSVNPSNEKSFWLRRFKEINLPNILRGLEKIRIAEAFNIPTHCGILSAKLIRKDGDILDYGIVSARVVTTVGAGFIIDALQNIVEAEIMKFHGIGTNNTAENVSDTALVAELTTQYLVNNTRATGSLGEGASGNIFRTVGTNDVDATVSIVEHGLFSNATVGSGVLFDRSVFAAINMVSGDQLQTTYDWTLSTGG